MNKRFKTVAAFIFFTVFMCRQSVAQFEYQYSQPRLLMGGGIALFRISLDDFESLYSNRWGESYGGFCGVRFYSSYYLNFKYNLFEKAGKSGLDPKTGLERSDARWRQSWYTIGLRAHPPITRRFNSYYGFGIVFYDVEEKENLSIFSQSNTQKADEWGNGFYLELGLEYLFIKELGLYFEMEISSGGVRGQTGFEGFSVGGFRFAFGMVAFPF